MKFKKTVVALVFFLISQLIVSTLLSVLDIKFHWKISNNIAYPLIVCNLLYILPLWLIKYFKISDLYKPVPATALILSILFGLSSLGATSLLLDTLSAPDYMEDTFRAMSHTFKGFISICIIGPISEEILMRRIILTNIRKATKSKWWGIIISASLFALMHLNPAQVLAALPAGIILGWLYCETRSLLVPICLHIANNTLSLVLMQLGINDDMPLSDPLTITILISCITIAVITCVMLLRFYKERTRDYYYVKERF